MLTAKAPGYTKADADADMIEGWKGTIIENKAARRTVTVYSSIGATGGMMFLDEYAGMVTDGTRTYTVDVDVATAARCG